MAELSPTSKSTKVSEGHNFWCKSSRDTSLPALAINSTSTRKGCSCSLIRTPLLRSSPSRSESSKGPKRKTRSREIDGSVGTHYLASGDIITDSTLPQGFLRTRTQVTILSKKAFLANNGLTESHCCEQPLHIQNH